VHCGGYSTEGSRTVLSYLRVILRPEYLYGKDLRSFGKQAAIDISASLVRNTNLKEFVLHGENQCEMDCFDSAQLLCDVSSIESISKSNHALKHIEVSDYRSNGTKTHTEITKQ
jgi:hypothetical protein